jgi:hypothetical protein
MFGVLVVVLGHLEHGSSLHGSIPRHLAAASGARAVRVPERRTMSGHRWSLEPGSPLGVSPCLPRRRSQSAIRLLSLAAAATLMLGTTAVALSHGRPRHGAHAR